MPCGRARHFPALDGSSTDAAALESTRSASTSPGKNRLSMVTSSVDVVVAVGDDSFATEAWKADYSLAQTSLHRDVPEQRAK